MAKILVLFAHPALEKSRVHARMLHHLKKVKNVTINDLYEEYPDFDVDVEREKKLLLAHDIIVMQHPFYWYSSPALIKQWMDLVLEHGWAYGSQGVALAGKKLMNAISSGGSRTAYSANGINRLTVPQYLAPFNQTARLCKMEYLPPFVVHSTHSQLQPEIEKYALDYASIISNLVNDSYGQPQLLSVEYLNDLLPSAELSNA